MSDPSLMFVKICGLRDSASAQVAVDAGADALGFILAPSKRQISAEQLLSISRSLIARSKRLPTTVGVMVNATAKEINDMVHVSGVDVIQLSGDEDPSILSRIETPAIKALRFPADTSLDQALAMIEPWYTAKRPAVRVVIEGFEVGSYGGSGAVADWNFVQQIALRYPIVLAGGLTPDNVVEAIESVGPQGVDVSSGVETDGVKDPEKIRVFIERAKGAAPERMPGAPG